MPSVMTESHMLWSHNGKTVVGKGELLRFDPGVGAPRYRRALEALSQTGKKLAFASFTFDPLEPGSVVIVPEEIESSVPHGEVNGSGVPRSHLVFDGVSAWRDGFRGALEAIDESKVAKVVLTRQVALQFDTRIPLMEIAHRLRTAQTDCYTFLVDGLIGASPELLVSLHDGIIASLALAGTAPNAESLGSEKMDLEHLLAAASVREGISRHVTELASPTRSVLEFGDIKHLATRFQGPAIDGATVLDVLETLHPTASVAGTPTETSLKLIREIEPRRRGRYAGPVGWFTADGEGEFALALRCGQVHGNEITLFAGGGIVNGSDTDSEFAETELKLQPMLRALDVEHR